MKPGMIPSLQISDYNVSTPLFNGPLDLLLQIIERAELDITKLALAQVTDQFLDYMNNLTEGAADELSAFLVIAAKLLQLKSETLLPRLPEQDPMDEEAHGDSLVRQLIIYKRFKEISKILSKYEADGLKTYVRLAPPPKIGTKVELEDINIYDLTAIAQEVFLNIEDKQDLDTVLSSHKVTLRQKISMIANRLKENEEITFYQLLNESPHRVDVVITFLAVLELIKRHLIQVRQSNLFDDIEIKLTSLWDEEEQFDLEFGE
jgi:segregation and condensation protein A